jgi:hypothetical protein
MVSIGSIELYHDSSRITDINKYKYYLNKSRVKFD